MIQGIGKSEYAFDRHRIAPLRSRTAALSACAEGSTRSSRASGAPWCPCVNNIFEAIPVDLRDEKCEALVETGRVRIERIVSKGHRSPETGWYDQEQNEWVMVLKGAAILAFEDEASVTLEAGDFVAIPAHKKHKVDWTAPDVETIWLAVHY